MAEETSLKELIQGMTGSGISITQGTVIAGSPLKIQMANDEKLIINERIAVVGKHLSDYTTSAKWDGETRTVTVYNALKVGDVVYVLTINNGKLYYVLDKVVSG